MSFILKFQTLIPNILFEYKVSLFSQTMSTWSNWFSREVLPVVRQADRHSPQVCHHHQCHYHGPGRSGPSQVSVIDHEERELLLYLELLSLTYNMGLIFVCKIL